VLDERITAFFVEVCFPESIEPDSSLFSSGFGSKGKKRLLASGGTSNPLLLYLQDPGMRVLMVGSLFSGSLFAAHRVKVLDSFPGSFSPPST